MPLNYLELLRCRKHKIFHRHILRNHFCLKWFESTDLLKKEIMCPFPIDPFPQNAIFHNFPQVIIFKHGFCSFLRISRTMGSTKPHSGFMKEKTSHNMCGLLHGDPANWWVLESVDLTPSQPPGTDMWDSGVCRLLCAASQFLDSLGYKH